MNQPIYSITDLLWFVMVAVIGMILSFGLGCCIRVATPSVLRQQQVIDAQTEAVKEQSLAIVAQEDRIAAQRVYIDALQKNRDALQGLVDERGKMISLFQQIIHKHEDPARNQAEVQP